MLRMPEQMRRSHDNPTLAILELERHKDGDVPRRAGESGSLTGFFGGRGRAIVVLCMSDRGVEVIGCGGGSGGGRRGSGRVVDGELVEAETAFADLFE